MSWDTFLLKWGLVLLLSFSSFNDPGSSPDLKEEFGVDYQQAVTTLNKNQWWADTLVKNKFDPAFSLAIVFPEIIRFSAISDYIETKALEVLYVQYGHDYADFSIGRFQMKPSFAEQIEEDIIRYNLTKVSPSLSVIHPKINDNPHLRKERILRLKDEYFQIKYLEAFILIMQKRYPEIISKPVEDQLVFYATAYNSGYRKGEKQISKESTRKYFYIGLTEPEKKFSYSQIAVEYYKSQK